MDNLRVEQEQKKICKKYNTPFIPYPLALKIGISKNISDDVQPLNGLRHPVEKGTCGWYLWRGGGIPQDDNNFFEPIHVAHLAGYCPEAIKYLGLPPGWRFQIDNKGYEDAWYDEVLLNV